MLLQSSSFVVNIYLKTKQSETKHHQIFGGGGVVTFERKKENLHNLSYKQIGQQSDQ